MQKVTYDVYQQVIIAAHAPPGFFERLAAVPFFNHTYNNAYVDLLNDFGENILVQIYGHEHTDSFKLFLGPQGMSARGISKLQHYMNFNYYERQGLQYISNSFTVWCFR